MGNKKDYKSEQWKRLTQVFRFILKTAVGIIVKNSCNPILACVFDK